MGTFLASLMFSTLSLYYSWVAWDCDSKTEKSFYLLVAFLLALLAIAMPLRNLYEAKTLPTRTELQLQNDSLTRALDSLHTKQTPCPDTLFIFLPPMR